MHEVLLISIPESTIAITHSLLHLPANRISNVRVDLQRECISSLFLHAVLTTSNSIIAADLVMASQLAILTAQLRHRLVEMTRKVLRLILLILLHRVVDLLLTTRHAFTYHTLLIW